jgi:RNA polymerase sigma factor (sigma-70 family)
VSGAGSTGARPANLPRSWSNDLCPEAADGIVPDTRTRSCCRRGGSPRRTARGRRAGGAAGRALTDLRPADLRARAPPRRSRARGGARAGDISSSLALEQPLRSGPRNRACLRLHAGQASRRGPAPAQILTLDRDDLGRGSGRARRHEAFDELVLALDVRDVLESLSPKHREVLELHHLADMTQAQIAARLEVPLGTVKTRTFHALRALRELLQERDLL